MAVISELPTTGDGRRERVPTEKEEATVEDDKEERERKRIERLKAAADMLRGEEGGIEVRTAVLNNGVRADFFRGKDFAAYWREHQEELVRVVTGESRAEKISKAKVDELIFTLVQLLFKYKLITVAERKHKKPRPGKTKLSKWPTTLVTTRPDWADGLFYCYTYERDRGMLYYVYAFLLLGFALFCCTYSIMPYIVKLSVAYIAMAILALFFGVFGVRLALFISVWILCGQSLWILPNIFNDELGVTESFKPIIAFDKDASPTLAMRGFAVAAIGGVVYFLSEHGPNQGDVRKAAYKAHDQVLQMFKVRDGMLGNKTENIFDVFTDDSDGKKPNGAGGGEQGADLDSDSEFTFDEPSPDTSEL